MERWDDGVYFSRRTELVYILCDKYSRIHVGNLLGLVNETAIDCDQYNGFDEEYFLEYGQIYVFARVAIRIKRLPQFRDVITITGWYTGVWDNRFHRDFEVKSESGEVLASARMEHALFDAVNRAALPTEALHLGLPEPCQKKADAPECKKILVEGRLPVLGYKTVYFSDIDDNGHMTYVSYIRTSIDFLPLSVQSSYRDIVANFVREIVEGETIELRGGETEAGYVVQGFVEDKLRFCCEFGG